MASTTGLRTESPRLRSERSSLRSTASRAWLLGPVMTAATLCGALLVLRGPDGAFAVALAALLLTVLVWVLTSVFWPARADRTCPACGKENLQRLDPGSTQGIACSACGHEDAGESSFLMAEEEGGPIEPIVIGPRAGRAGRAG